MNAPVGFWVRLGAHLIDMAVILTAQMLMGVVLALSGQHTRLASLLGVVLLLAYETFMISRYGQTLGKMAAGAKVVRADDGAMLSTGQALGRSLAKILSSVILGLGHLAAAFTPRKRALQDYLAGAVVVYPEEVSRGRKIALVVLGATLPAAGLAGFLAAFSWLKPPPANKEGSMKMQLGQLRGAASIYYGEHEGIYPASLTDVPTLELDDHPGGSTEVTRYGSEICADGRIDGAKLRDTGHWGYVVAPETKCHGSIFVDCTHRDSKGIPVYSY